MSSKTLNKDQLLCLNRILKLIIPSDKHKNLPGADGINIFDFLEKYYPDFIKIISNELENLKKKKKKRYSCSFKELSESNTLSLCEDLHQENNEFLNELTLITYECYYQSDEVLEKIGITRKPPFPEGNKVLSGNLEILNPVRKMRTKYIDV
jgi:hypothetical protein